MIQPVVLARPPFWSVGGGVNTDAAPELSVAVSGVDTELGSGEEDGLEVGSISAAVAGMNLGAARR